MDGLDVPRLPAKAHRLLVFPATAEPAWRRWLFLLLALGVTGGFFFSVLAYHATGPGMPAIDENAYLVAGKNIARHGSPGFLPASPFAYVGPMWVRAGSGWYYPKYPFGVPILNAIAIRLAGSNLAACYVSLVCGTLSVLAMFLLARLVAGSFFGLLACVALATNSTLLQLSLVPSSHAPAICFVLWGMYLLLDWWSTGSLWAGALAGLCLGFAVTIRYTEALLLFPLYPLNPINRADHPTWHKLFYVVRFLPVGPIGLAAIAMVRWTNWRSYLRVAVPLLAWALPVGALLLFNWRTLHTLTGYDATYESTGFTYAEFKGKWEYTIQQLHAYGLFMLLPLGLAGMLMLVARSWRVGLFLLLWFIPSVLLYMAYYWGQQAPGLSYLRFFLTLYPPIIVAAVWLLWMAGRGVVGVASGVGSAPARARTTSEQMVRSADPTWLPVGAVICLFIGATGAAGVYVAVPAMQRQRTHNTNLAFTANKFLEAVPSARAARAARRGSDQPVPLLLADGGGMFGGMGGQLLWMQFVGDGEWYSTAAFTPRSRFFGGRTGPRFGAAPSDDDQPNPVLFDPARQAYLKGVYDRLTSTQLAAEEVRLLNEALQGGREVYALVNRGGGSGYARRLGDKGFVCTSVASWKEPKGEGAGQGGATSGPGFGSLFGPPGGRDRGGGRFGPFGGRNTGGLAPPGAWWGRPPQPQSLEVLQITLRPPPPATTQSATTAPDSPVHR